MCTMFKRLFRVYAHMYIHHFVALKAMGAEPHLNTCARLHAAHLLHPRAPPLAPLCTLHTHRPPTRPRLSCFPHFVLFVLEFDLIDARVPPQR